MANIDNQCKDLSIKDLYSQSTTHLHDMMSHQKEMQEKTYGIKFQDMTIAEIMKFWHSNTHAIIDEIHEMTDALGGIKDGYGSAVWKYWKKDHKKFENMKISDLSDDDRKELFMEWVDVFHFFMNYSASIGIDAQTAYNYYYAKAEENKQRQHRGY